MGFRSLAIVSLDQLLSSHVSEVSYGLTRTEWSSLSKHYRLHLSFQLRYESAQAHSLAIDRAQYVSPYLGKDPSPELFCSDFLASCSRWKFVQACLKSYTIVIAIALFAIVLFAKFFLVREKRVALRAKSTLPPVLCYGRGLD